MFGSNTYAERMLKNWLKEHKLQSSMMKHAPAFDRNLEKALDTVRNDFGLMTIKPRWDDSVIDWTTSDFLSLNRSGQLREALKEELELQGEYLHSAAGSRTQYGNYDYLLNVEKEVARFHNAETAWICHSGFFANVGVLESVPLPGDAIVYDELVHASTHHGMRISAAAYKLSFRHNDPISLRDVLSSLQDTYPAFRTGTQSILICVESIYSMNGDICPLKECVGVVKELFPLGNAQFVIDEAHSTGVLGPNGAGLVQMLGLEKEIAIRIHMCSKALASTGGVILCSKTIRRVLVHQARCLTYSGAPSTPMVASIRVGYAIFASGWTTKPQERIQTIVKYFFHQLTANPVWEQAVNAGLLSCPLSEDWELHETQSHVVPIHTRPRHEQYLFFHMSLAGMNAYNISYPVVPKGSSRVRMIFHAHNTEHDVDTAVAAICGWAAEMLDIEDGASNATLPKAVLQVYAMQAALA